jgi:death-on-curing protein
LSNNFLSVDDVLGIHQDSIDAFGGAAGLRDRGLLESAVMRPQSGYYPDAIAEAAALWESLSQNHPFVDGNKRTAIAAAAAHLAINGYWLQQEELETYRFIIDLYTSGRFRMPQLARGLAASARRPSRLKHSEAITGLQPHTPKLNCFHNRHSGTVVDSPSTFPLDPASDLLNASHLQVWGSWGQN